MTLQTVSPSGSDIQDLDVIKLAVLDCEQLNSQGIGERYALIGEILLQNATRLGLDEDIDQLLSFARCVGCELLSPASQEAHFPGGCWAADARRRNGPPFFLKRGGRNRDISIIRPIEKQKIAMAMIVLAHISRDPAFAMGAEKLIQFEEENNLWTLDDGADLSA